MIINSTIAGGGGGGAVEYVMPLKARSYSGCAFFLSDEGLTVSDFASNSTSHMWVVFNEACGMDVFLDQYDDDDFHLTIPAGTVIYCTECYANGLDIFGKFPFVTSGGAYGYVTIIALNNSGDIEAYFYSNGEDPSLGCAVQSSGYQVSNNGGAYAFGWSDRPTPIDCELHILKTS